MTQNPQHTHPALLAVLAGILLLTGCASLNEKECHTADWRMIGYEDGAAGNSATRLGEHREACAKHGITPDMAAYRQGRDEGLGEYCRPRRAYQLGRNGYAYPAVCPATLEEELRLAWDDGRRLYEQQQAVRHLENELAHARQELKDIRSTLASHAGEIAFAGTLNARRLELLAEMRNLAKQEVVVENEIDALEYELAQQRAQLGNLQSSNQ